MDKKVRPGASNVNVHISQVPEMIGNWAQFHR